MKSDNYEELMDRYFAGTASEEDIHILHSESMIEEEDKEYKSALKGERKINLQWEFEDFIAKVQKPKEVHGVNRLWIKKSLAAAAIAGALVFAWLFWETHKQDKELAGVPINILEQENPEDSKVINKIPANNGLTALIQNKKINQKVKIRPALKGQKSASHRHAATKNTQTEPEEILVVFNGRPITDETEALTIARESIALLYQNISYSIEEIKPISKIKLKL